MQKIERKMEKIERRKDDRNKSAQLPTQILITILLRLEVVDWIHAGRVCVSWREAWLEMVARNLRPPSHQLPLLIVSWEKEFYRVFNLSGNKVYGLHLSQAGKARCLGSFDEWLILIDEMNGCFLLNVTSRDCIRLPRNSVRHGRYMEHFWKRLLEIDAKAILSSDPTSGDSTVVITCGNKMALCRVGDAAWTILKGEPNGYHHTSDITFYNGHVLTVYRSIGGLNIYELDPRLKSKKWKTLPEIKYPGNATCVHGIYLVESCGELLVVLKFFGRKKFRDEGRFMTTFSILKMDPNGSRWIKVESLGDQMIFLGYSKSLSTKGLSGFKRNCIYFTKDVFLSIDSGVFDLEDGSMGLFPLRIPYNICYEPIWVTPYPKH